MRVRGPALMRGMARLHICPLASAVKRVVGGGGMPGVFAPLMVAAVAPACMHCGWLCVCARAGARGVISVCLRCAGMCERARTPCHTT